MDISEAILKEYLIPKDYDKPRIEIGNYFLKWDDDNKSYGIHPREIPELKGFLKKAIAFLDTSYELLSKLEKSKYKDKYPLHTGLSPLILLSYKNKDHRVSYELYMRSDGSTFIDRVEGIEISNNNNNILANKGKLRQNFCNMFQENLQELPYKNIAMHQISTSFILSRPFRTPIHLMARFRFVVKNPRYLPASNSSAIKAQPSS